MSIQETVKFKYDRIYPAELAAGVAALGLDAEEFLRITGTGATKKWREWMEEKVDIPHDVHVMLEIFTAYPQAIDLAKRIADEYGTVEPVTFRTGNSHPG